LTPAAEEMLLRNYWPGNIRELKNLLERLCIMVPEAEITEVHLNEVIPGGDKNRDMMHFNAGSATLKQAKNDFERAFILEKLEEFGWNVSKTAEAIGVERSNLHRKLKTYDIDTKKLKG
jgi:two-component system nitrogen regulation response regulator NtrX